jgi:hypothetical protein
LLRIERGLPAQRRATSETAIYALIAVLTLGHLHIHHRPATIQFKLPQGVAEIVHEGLPRETGVLWSLEGQVAL